MKKFSVLLVAILALMMLFVSCENEPEKRAATKEDGEIIKGKSGQTHAQILENYMKQIDKEEDIPEDYKEDGGNIDGSRPSTYRLKRLVNTENNAYGNVIDNVALIEVLENVSEQEVANVCKKQLKVDKVYMVSRNSKTDVVKRLAKIIRMDV